MDEKKKLKRAYGPTHSMVAKVTAFILCIIMLCVTAVSIVGIVIMWSAEVYTYPEERLRYETFEEMTYGNIYNIIWHLKNNSEPDSFGSSDIFKYNNIASVKVENYNDGEVLFEESPKYVNEKYVYSSYYYIDKILIDGNEAYEAYVIPDRFDINDYDSENIRKITIGIAEDLTSPDEYFWIDILIGMMYALKYWIYPIGVTALIFAIVCFIFLMCAAGKRKGILEPAPSNLTKVPFEIPTLAAFLAVIFSFYIIDAVDHNDVAFIVAAICVCICWAVIGIIWLMSLAVRIKLGTIFTNTVTYRILRFIWRALCFVGRCIRSVVRAIPLTWKAVLAFGVISVVEFFVIIISRYVITLLILWIFGKCAAFVALMYCVIMLQRLKHGGKEIADGNVDHKVDTAYLVLDLKDHADDLNRIGEGINIAVEERMKSERMKTELITNVSHDIKTPLTSIINYSDLICREECDNENIKEYSAILHNQSERMKRLIDDLVEASKASSGNIDIALIECDARVLISQASGEYSQRMTDAGLELVCSSPENEIRIMADGRRIWRVFDNLMNNARKYALPGTRVYLSLEEIEECAVFKFRNISREPLSVDASELTERFVRGDASRNTEGNGLGLSIAKSMTELQGGEFDITVDGDLFKVTLTFPKVK